MSWPVFYAVWAGVVAAGITLGVLFIFVRLAWAIYEENLEARPRR
jgi:hypothetical protein